MVRGERAETPCPGVPVAHFVPLNPRGALLAGIIADWFGLAAAIWAVAALTAVSGLVVAVRMYETHVTSRHAPTAGRLAAES
jgi:hypothetical protein